MKNMIRKALACLVVLAAFTLQSCLSDLFVTDAAKAKLDITFEWFEPSTRSGEDALNIPDGAKMFLDFDGMHTYATYNNSTQRWTLDDVPSRESGSVTAFYAGTSFGDGCYLQPAMKGTGTYDNTGDALSVSVRLQPQCGRLRFAGEPGKTVVVEDGLRYVYFIGYDNMSLGVSFFDFVYTPDSETKIEINQEHPLINSIEQLSSPMTEPTEGSIAALIDGDAGTFWHSQWSNERQPDNGVDYIQIEMTENDITNAAFVYTRRAIRSDQLTEASVYGTNDAEAEKADCELLATVSLPYGADNETLTSGAFPVKGYRYIRIYEEATTNNRGYFHMAELQLYPATVSSSSTPTQAVELTVQPDGFTPYVYGFFLDEGNPYVTYTYDGQTALKLFTSNFLTAGRSGFINLGPDQPYYGPVLEGDYLIQNVETGLFLNGANSWGTQASAVPHGQFMTLSHQGDGRHTIDTHIFNGGNDHFLGNNGYVDASMAAHTFCYDSNSQTWTIQAEETGLYLYNEDGNTVAFNSYDVSDRARWRIISKDEYMRSFYSATSSAPVDATPLIPDANFSRNNQDFYMWQGDMPAKGGDNSNMNAERWGGNTGTFDSYVTINDIPNGYYSLSVQGYYRYNNTDDNTNDIAAAAHADGTEVINSYFYANEVEEPLMSIADEAAVEALGWMPFSQGEASAAFNMGLYKNAPLMVHVTNGQLRIGVKKTQHLGCDWTVWDNFELTYMGTAEVVIPEADSESSAPAGYAWTKNLVRNGNFASDDMTSFSVQGEGVTSSIVNLPGGARALEVVSVDRVFETWDSQMFIISDEAFQEGDYYYVSFAYSAAKSAYVHTQAHQDPGVYNHWEMLLPDLSFTTEWQAASWEGVITGEQAQGIGMKSIAFDLNEYEKSNKYYLTNVVVKKRVAGTRGARGKK